MKRFILSFLAAALIALAFIAPSSAATILHRGNMNEPDTLDPQKATGSWEDNILGDLFLGLMTEDPKGEPIYGAAESHTVSTDGLVYTFVIRKGLVWSDGAPVIADDFVLGMRRLVDPVIASQYASVFYPIKNAQAVNASTMPVAALGVRAIDDRTLAITLEHPTPYMLELVMQRSTYSVPKHLIDRVGEDWTKPGIMVTDGPYVLAEWAPNTYVKVVKNPLFFDAANVSIDEIIFYPTDDAEAALKRFRAGELDVNNGIASQNLEFVRKDLPAETRIFTSANTRYIVFNNARAPFDDVRVRKALSMAIDREALTEKVLRAGEVPAYSLVPPGTANYGGEAQLSFKGVPLAERIAQAKDLLAQAGFGPDNPLAFNYNYIADNDSRRIAVALQDMWRQIGAVVALNLNEKKVHYNLSRVGDFAVAESNWIADYNDGKTFLIQVQPSSGELNESRYASEVFENLMDQADAAIDLGARAKIMAEAEQVMLDDNAVAPLFYGVSRSLVRPYVEGWVDNLTNVHRARYLRLNRPLAATP